MLRKNEGFQSECSYFWSGSFFSHYTCVFAIILNILYLRVLYLMMIKCLFKNGRVYRTTIAWSFLFL